MARGLSLWAALTCVLGCWPLGHGAESERNNWVILVGTSKYYYNYRHTANTLVMYHTVKRLGIPDSNIILMLAEDIPCNSRSAQPGLVVRDHVNGQNLYGEDVEVDYRGDEVTIENFIRLLTGRHSASTPRNKRLLSDSMSNVLIYITGHSGDEFIKFQDWEEMTSNDVANAFQQMHKQRRYRNIFWISDTCQAATLQNQFYTPGILAYGSSGKGENSYSHHSDDNIGTAVIDRWTFHSFDFLRRLTTGSKLTVDDFTRHFQHSLLRANPELRTDLFDQHPAETRMTEFFASTGRMRFQSLLLQMKASRDSTPDEMGCAAGGGGAEGSCRAPGWAEEVGSTGGSAWSASAAKESSTSGVGRSWADGLAGVMAPRRPGAAFTRQAPRGRSDGGVVRAEFPEMPFGLDSPWILCASIFFTVAMMSKL